MRRKNRNMAAILLSAMMAVSCLGSAFAYGEEASGGEEAAVISQETSVPETQPETAPPETAAPETSAPETQPETSAPETSAPETQPETTTPETGASESGTSAGEAETDHTPAQTEATESESRLTETETQTEVQTETQTETEAPVSVLTAAVDGARVTLKLKKGAEVPAGTKLNVRRLTKGTDGAVYEKALQAIKAQTDQGHRQLGSAAIYTIALEKDQRTLPLTGIEELSLAYSSPLSLNLTKEQEGEAALFAIDAGAAKVGVPKQNKAEEILSFSVKNAESGTLAVCSIINRTAQGEKLTQSGLEKALQPLLPYMLTAERLEGFKDSSVLSDQANVQTGEDAGKTLREVEKVPAMLADATDSDTVSFVTVYADEKGEISWTPIGTLQNQKKNAIDVTDATVVVTVVVDPEAKELTLRPQEIENRHVLPQDTEAEQAALTAGRVLYNIVAEDGTSVTAYEGKILIKEDLQGTLLAPEASVILEKDVTGAVYAKEVSAAETTVMTSAILGAEAVEEETETASETATQEVTEKETETEAEIASGEPAAMEPVSETEAPRETETASEVVTETETATEAVTEEATEIVTETETETETAAPEVEEETETETEAQQEDAAPAENSSVTLKIEVRDTTLTGALLQGAQIAIRNQEDGEVLRTEDGRACTFITTDSQSAITLDTKDYPVLANLEAGKSLVLMVSELTTPVVGSDHYEFVGDAQQPLTVSKDAEGNLSIEAGAEQITFLNKKKETLAQPYKLLVTKQHYSGTAQTAVSEDTNSYFALFSDEALEKRVTDITKITISHDQKSAERTVENLAQAVYYLAETDAYGKVIGNPAGEDAAQETFYARTLVGGTEGNRIDFTDQVAGSYLSAVIENHDYAITVTKRLYCEDKVLYAENQEQKFYVTLFEDAACTKPIWQKDAQGKDIEEAYVIALSAGKTYASIVIDGLTPGTYYLAETDAKGALIGVNAQTEPFYATYESGDAADDDPQKIVITAGKTAADASVTVKNHYKELPDWTVYTASFQLKLAVTDANGKAKSVSGTFYIGIYDRDTGTRVGVKSITLNKQSGRTVPVTLKMHTPTRNLVFRELNADKSALTDNQYKLGDSYYTPSVAPAEITLDIDQETLPLVTITNQEVKQKETEDPGADVTKEKAVLKLTKKVTYKGQPIRVNSVYYLGIFKDAGLTDLYYTKKLVFKNASEVTATLKINLAKAAGNEVTFYFAEVDAEKDGKPVGSSFGYDVSRNKSSVTLNAKNMEEEVVFTNSVKVGGTVEGQLTNPSSGLAGDAAALAQAQQLASDASSGENTRTWDKTVIRPYQVLLIVSVAAIVAVLVALLLVRRRRRR